MKMIQLSRFKLNDKNPRKIKPERFRQLVKSVQDFPAMLEIRQIVYDGNYIVIAGNQRFKALIELGFIEAPETWFKSAAHLTDEERRRFIMMDNEDFGETDWDEAFELYDKNELQEWSVITPDVPEPTKTEIKEVELQPYKKTHVLISFAPEKMVLVQELLQKLKDFSFVEYEQSNN